MVKIQIPESKDKIEQTIKALESSLPLDDEKSRKYHEEAIEDLKRALKEYGN